MFSQALWPMMMQIEHENKQLKPMMAVAPLQKAAKTNEKWWLGFPLPQESIISYMADLTALVTVVVFSFAPEDGQPGGKKKEELPAKIYVAADYDYSSSDDGAYVISMKVTSKPKASPGEGGGKRSKKTREKAKKILLDTPKIPSGPTIPLRNMGAAQFTPYYCLDCFLPLTAFEGLRCWGCVTALAEPPTPLLSGTRGT